MASWSVLGVLLSRYPSLAARQTHIDNLVFGGAVVGPTALAAALAGIRSAWSVLIRHRPTVYLGRRSHLLVALAARRPLELTTQRSRVYARGSGIPSSAITVRSRVG